MNRFGQLLRYYRRQAICPDGGGLTQKRLGELLGEVLGDAGYSGAAVSEWERENSQIHKDQRPVLLALIRVLQQCHGLSLLNDANTLLLAGNYRPLDSQEEMTLFPGSRPSKPPENNPLPQALTTSLDEVTDRLRRLFTLEGEWRWWLKAAILSRWSRQKALWLLAWATLWLLTSLLAFPLLDWPPAEWAVWSYMAASLVLPLGVTLMTYSLEKTFWQSQVQVKRPQVLFFTFIGALAGFHLGYLLALIGRLAAHYLLINTMSRLPAALAAGPLLFLSYNLAQQVPFHVWRLQHPLPVQGDHLVLLLIFLLAGPLLGWLFWFASPWLLSWFGGLTLIFLAIIIIAVSLAWSHQASSVWLPLLYTVFVLILFVRSQDSLVHGAITLGGGIALIIAWIQGRVQATVPAALLGLAIAGLVFLGYQLSEGAGRLAALLALILWWWRGKPHLSFPPTVWLVGAAATVTLFLVGEQGWPAIRAVTAFGLATTAILSVELWLIHFPEMPNIRQVLPNLKKESNYADS